MVLDCFNEFITKCDPGFLSSMQASVVKPMIEKCLGQTKASLKAKSLECMMLIFEVSENFEDETTDVIVELMKKPKPKVSNQTLMPKNRSNYGSIQTMTALEYVY